MASPEKHLAANALRQLATTVVGMGAGIGLSILVARALGPAEMGSYALALMVVSALETLAGIGLARTARKFAAELSGTPAAPRAVWWLLVRRAASGLLAAAGLVLAAPILGLVFHDARLPPLLVVGSVLLATNLLTTLLEFTLGGASRFDLLAAVTVGLTPLHVLATVAALWLGAGALGVMLAQVVFGLPNVALLLALNRRAGLLAWRPDPPTAPLAARMVRFTRHSYQLSLLTFVVHDRTEVLVLGALAPAEQISFYSLAASAAEAAMRLGPWIVATLFFPLMAAQWAGGDRSAAAAYYAQCLRYLGLLAAPFALGGMAVAEAGVAVVFGPAYAPMVPVLRVTLLAAAAAALAQGPAAILTVAERQDWLVWVRGSLAVGNLLLDLVLVPRYAAMGAAWAVLVVATAEAVLLGWLAWRLGAAAPLSGLGLAVSAGAVSSGSAWLALGDRTDAVGLAIALVTATAAYIGILAVCRFFRPEDAEVVAPLLQRMPLPMRGPGRRLLGVR